MAKRNGDRRILGNVKRRVALNSSKLLAITQFGVYNFKKAHFGGI